MRGRGPDPSLGRPACRRPSREDDVGADELAARAREAPGERRGDAERRVGDDVERAVGEAQVRGVGDHDLHVLTGEAVAKLRGSFWMELNGDDACPGSDERPCDCAGTGADV